VTSQLLEEIGFKEAARASITSAAAADRKLKSVDQVLASLSAYEKREGPKADLMTYLNRLSLDTRPEEDDGEHSCDPELLGRIKQVGAKHGIQIEQIGSTIREHFEITMDGKVVVSAPVRELKDAWSQALERALHVETEERLVPELLQRS
jgi:superfamily I DNA/RNA helicase